jgi:hypothetical protein
LKNKKRLKEFTISIAGIGMTFFFDRSHFEFREDIGNGFITAKESDIKFQVHRDDIPEKNIEEVIFDSDSTWSLCRSQGRYILQDCSIDSSLWLEKLVILEPDFKSGEIYTKDNDSNQSLLLDPLGHPLNQVLMIILLSRSKGVMFHACGIVDKGSGYLFLGNSAHGKSTMARLWSENQAQVLNDDRIIVREKVGELWMYGTPWHGDFREVSSKGLPIRKLFFLQHGNQNSVILREGGEAVSMLLTRCFPPLWDKKGMDYTIGLCHLIANTIPCYELNFIPDGRIINFIRNL